MPVIEIVSISRFWFPELVSIIVLVAEAATVLENSVCDDWHVTHTLSSAQKPFPVLFRYLNLTSVSLISAVLLRSTCFHDGV